MVHIQKFGVSKDMQVAHTMSEKAGNYLQLPDHLYFYKYF